MVEYGVICQRPFIWGPRVAQSLVHRIFFFGQVGLQSSMFAYISSSRMHRESRREALRPRRGKGGGFWGGKSFRRGYVSDHYAQSQGVGTELGNPSLQSAW